MKIKILFVLVFSSLGMLTIPAWIGCSARNETQSADALEILKQREQAFMEKKTDNPGKLIDSITFEVRTKNTVDYKNGLVPWASLEKPDRDLPKLIDPKKIIINEKALTVIIDYPLKHEYRLELRSANGFNRAFLLKEISKAYYKLYEEEETTATIKTIPIKKRTTMNNRNETNGKYGIWGHDIANLLLSGILVYKTDDDKIVLALNIES